MTFGDIIDYVGTYLHLPETGLSEKVNGYKPTVYTGLTSQSKKAGLDKWRYDHFEKPKGGAPNPTEQPKQTDLVSSGYRSITPVSPTSTLPTNAGEGANELALAEMARRNRINSYKAQAGNLRSQARGTFDTILSQVNAFRDRAKTQFTNAGQEITNRSSEILGNNARTAQETSGEARARARAMGLGDSSRFRLQNKVTGNLAATQGNTIARRGDEQRANQALYQERQDEAQGQENQANTYLRNALDRATTVENTGYDAAEETFSNALNDIVNYQRNLASMRPVQASGLTQFTPNFNGITNTINGILSGIKGGGVSEEEAGNPVNPTNVFELLKRRGLVTG